MSVPVLAPEAILDGQVTVIELGPGYQILDEQLLDTGVEDSLAEIVAQADPPLVVLDLSHVRFFGSSFIEILFRLWNNVQARPGGAFALCGLTPHCLDVLKITHLDTLWKLFATRAEAVQALDAKAR